MIIRWFSALSTLIHRGYNSFVYGSTQADSTGPTIVFGLSGR